MRPLGENRYYLAALMVCCKRTELCPPIAGWARRIGDSCWYKSVEI